MIGFLMDFDRLGDRLKKSQERIQGGAKQVCQFAAEAQAKADGARAVRETAREEARERQAANTKRALIIVVPVIVVCFAALGILGAVEGGKKQADAVTTPSASPSTSVPSSTPSPVSTSDAPAAPPSAAAPAVAPGATTTGLTGTYAQSACDQYGQQQFPCGWNPHWITGRLADEAQGETYYLKYTATVTNASNAKQDINFECYVTGTNDNPTVSNFVAY